MISVARYGFYHDFLFHIHFQWLDKTKENAITTTKWISHITHFVVEIPTKSTHYKLWKVNLFFRANQLLWYRLLSNFLHLLFSCFTIFSLLENLTEATILKTSVWSTNCVDVSLSTIKNFSFANCNIFTIYWNLNSVQIIHWINIILYILI